MENEPEPKFKWTELLRVGVESMDEEHKILIDHMNRVHDLNSSSAKKDAILSALSELIEYSKQHFADEEKFMTSIEYPDLKNHQKAHLALIERLEDNYRLFENGASHIPEGFFAFLGFWLKTHIHMVDCKYGHFAKHGY